MYTLKISFNPTLRNIRKIINVEVMYEFKKKAFEALPLNQKIAILCNDYTVKYHNMINDEIRRMLVSTIYLKDFKFKFIEGVILLKNNDLDNKVYRVAKEFKHAPRSIIRKQRLLEVLDNPDYVADAVLLRLNSKHVDNIIEKSRRTTNAIASHRKRYMETRKDIQKTNIAVKELFAKILPELDVFQKEGFDCFHEQKIVKLDTVTYHLQQFFNEKKRTIV